MTASPTDLGTLRQKLLVLYAANSSPDIRLWRYLASDPDFDVALWWTRIENTPETVYRNQLA